MKRILVECHHTLGDVIMTLPALVNLRNTYPDAQIDYMCGLENEVQLLKSTKLVDQTFIYNVKENSWSELAALALRLRSRKYELAVSFGGSPRGLDVLFLKLSGCRRIVAASEPRAIWKKYEKVDVPEGLHRVERAVRITEAVTGGTEIAEVTLQPDTSLIQTLSDRFEIRPNVPVVGLVTGTGNFMYRKGNQIIQYNTKKWELQKFVSLSETLLAEGCQVVLIGGEKEQKECMEQGIIFDSRVINTMGQLEIMESVAVMSLCELVVGADTGPMHAAAAAGIKTLTLFGPTDASLIAPYGENSHILESGYPCRRCFTQDNEKGRTCSPAKCMQAITVDESLKRIKEIVEI